MNFFLQIFFIKLLRIGFCFLPFFKKLHTNKTSPFNQALWNLWIKNWAIFFPRRSRTLFISIFPLTNLLMLLKKRKWKHILTIITRYQSMLTITHMIFQLFLLVSLHTKDAMFLIRNIRTPTSSKLTRRTHEEMYVKAILVYESMAIGTTFVIHMHCYIFGSI